MRLVNRVVVPLRALLALLFLGLVVAQLLSMPGQLAHMAEQEPELAYLRWPLLTFAVLELACAQVVIVCTWRLLTLVREDHIFSEGAFAWVDAIVWAMAAAWLMLVVVFVYFTALIRGPGLPVLLFGMVLAGGVVVLLMVVMRALLRQATSLRTDLEAVI
ncbi:DUF2975 domain-containing protein [Nocardioides donggukensis]|uniref:DUF2975 domain-containing protein n=1 Tax=Nocardioides donggukensis TaxID=2774019 RepID=A0A927K8E9_9ACTN|nr:DUF2975 domain-containing protein [Nocardioides donggukensis]MBD8869560.1 DUF2975 domain-containing protein [Nocardioides donggukensis]